MRDPVSPCSSLPRPHYLISVTACLPCRQPCVPWHTVLRPVTFTVLQQLIFVTLYPYFEQMFTFVQNQHNSVQDTSRLDNGTRYPRRVNTVAKVTYLYGPTAAKFCDSTLYYDV